MRRSFSETALNLYLPFMDEVVARIDILNMVVRNKPQLAAGFVHELCFLQFRAICEVVALGCIALHVDETQSKKIMNTYEADKIMKALEKQKPGFFPKPLKFERTATGIQIGEREDESALTKEDLIKLWGLCGTKLHRTPFRKAISPLAANEMDLSAVTIWGNKITQLLSQHLIRLDERTLMLVSLRDVETKLPSAQIVEVSVDRGTANVVRVLHRKQPRDQQHSPPSKPAVQPEVGPGI